MFLYWIDKNETPILDQALLACENIELKANWEKEESKPTGKPTVETDKPKTYRCPDGYTLNGTKCISETEKVPVTESCETGYTYSPNRGLCYQSVSPTKVCNKYNDTDGVIIEKDGNTYCGYSEKTRFNGDKRSCEHSNYEYAVNDKCYWKVFENNFTLECESGYRYYTGLYFSNKQVLPVCAKTQATIRTCSSGYSQDGNYCYKVVDATLE